MEINEMELSKYIEELKNAAYDKNLYRMIEIIKKLVPTYEPKIKIHVLESV